MEKSMSEALQTSLFCFFFIAVISFCFNSGCIPSEREALLEFKNKLKDPSNRLQSWDTADGDCCKWYGVICSNLTGHVHELHLRSLSYQEYYGVSDVPEYYSDYIKAESHKAYYYDYHEKSTFGGEISSSLLNLKELRYLDLSNNYFDGKPYPKFLGSLNSLRFLNLSGVYVYLEPIPHELGNLSNLQYLNFHGTSADVGSLDWINGLSKLKFLDLSGVYLPSNSLETLSKLPSLVQLHLSDSGLSDIPEVLVNASFSSLSILDLSSNQFSQSSIPNWIFHLKNLKSLDLSSNTFQGPIHNNFQNMTSLQKLDLSDNTFSEIPKWILNLTTLHFLNFRANWFEGSIPNELQHVSSIKELDLSRNRFNSTIPNWLYNFRHLEVLNLAKNFLQGKISSAIQNMTSLTSLALSENVELEGGISNSFKNLCNLKSLSFSSVKLGQDMNHILQIQSGCASNLLEFLDLPNCELSGKLSNQLGNFKNLIYLSLSNNSISGPIPFALAKLMSLRFLLLDHNKLGGSIPVGLGGLVKLEYIDISYNTLEGVVSEMHFANFTNLKKFDGSMNQLILRVGSDWIPPFHCLQFLKLTNWDIGAQFPGWLHTLKYLDVVDLSNSTLSSSIPNWFWNSSFQFVYLNLSCNQIRGVIPEIVVASDEIDLNSNLFEGLVPRFSSSTLFVDFSNNSFSGAISHFICDKMHGMYILDLGNNLLMGEIPDCWSNWTSLNSLSLSHNNFSGNVPKSIGNIPALRFLNLRNNRLTGEIPLSFQNCISLSVLELGENELIGHIPNWIWASLPLKILILRANKFQGKIPNEICHMKDLRILDLSHNFLSGIIPTCIDNITAMATTNSLYFPLSFGITSKDGTSAYFSYDARIFMKGRSVEYVSILRYVKIIDLASNNLSGEIPKKITRLLALQSLNLSNNFLFGEIPEDIGDMRWLEVLDFSRNQLNGRIPQSMTHLTFLSMLNLSYNNLSGRIPTGTQLQSFTSASFIGNEGLFGPPLIDNTTTNSSVPAHNGENGKGGDEVDWGLYVSMAVGFIVGFWSILSHLVVNRQWRHQYYLFLDRLWNEIWWYLRWSRGGC